MKSTEGTLIFSIELDGQLILYAFEKFSITHGLTYATDASCQVVKKNGTIDFRFSTCELKDKQVILAPKETVKDIKDL